jgi:VIT1/CCC1 family predicted Fe2+/Mn2+ transporter
VGAEARFKRYALGELLDHELYLALAARERNERNRRLLEELARDELKHYEFWSRLSGPVQLGLRERVKLSLLLALSRVAGKTFTIKLLERGEASTVSEYKRATAELEGELAAELARVIGDEERHESELASSLDELAVRQLGSIALGVSDAIIELTGVLAGFAGYTGSPVQVAAAGLIVGVSAALSMAAAAYSQAKHERGKSPPTAASFTGLFYMLTVLALVAPLLLGVPTSLGVALSLVCALAILAAFSFYSAVVMERPFLREYLENAAVIMAVSLVGYAFGQAVKELTGGVP